MPPPDPLAPTASEATTTAASVRPDTKVWSEREPEPEPDPEPDPMLAGEAVNALITLPVELCRFTPASRMAWVTGVSEGVALLLPLGRVPPAVLIVTEISGGRR